MQTNAVNSIMNAQVMFDIAASRVSSAAAGLTDSRPPAADEPDLAGAMVGLMSAQLAYSANAKVLSMSLEHDRSVLDLLA